MTTAQQRDKDRDLDGHLPDSLNDRIAEQVVHTLGTPDDLVKVEVRSVGGTRYRVNVFVGGGVTSARIADSFFLTADADGTILTSSPQIVKLY